MLRIKLVMGSCIIKRPTRNSPVVLLLLLLLSFLILIKINLVPLEIRPDQFQVYPKSTLPADTRLESHRQENCKKQTSAGDQFLSEIQAELIFIFVMLIVLIAN